MFDGQHDQLDPLACLSANGVCADHAILMIQDDLEKSFGFALRDKAIQCGVHPHDLCCAQCLSGLLFGEAHMGYFRLHKYGPG